MPTQRYRPTKGWNALYDSEQFRSGDTVPNIFGTIQSTQLLALIAKAGSADVESLSSALNTTRIAMRRRLDRLQAQGLLCAATSFKRFVSIDNDHPCGLEITAISLAVANHWKALPTIVVGQPIDLKREWRGKVDLSSLLGNRGRTKVLAMLSALEEVPLTQLANVLGIRRFSLDQILAELKTYGLTTDRTDGYRRYVSLNPAFFAAKELRAILQAIKKSDTSYDSMTRLLENIHHRIVLVR